MKSHMYSHKCAEFIIILKGETFWSLTDTNNQPARGYILSKGIITSVCYPEIQISASLWKKLASKASNYDCYKRNIKSFYVLQSLWICTLKPNNCQTQSQDIQQHCDRFPVSKLATTRKHKLTLVTQVWLYFMLFNNYSNKTNESFK